MARVWATASLLFVAAFVLGGREQSANWPTPVEWIGLGFFPIGIVVGLLLGYWKELPGGSIAVASLIGFYVWFYVVAGRFASGPWFALIAAPGLLFLVSGLLQRASSVTPIGTERGLSV